MRNSKADLSRRSVLAGVGVAIAGAVAAAPPASAATTTDLSATYVPLAGAAKGNVLVGSGADVSAWQAPRMIDARDFLCCDGTTDDSAALSTLITALQAATAGYPAATVIEFPPCSVKLWANQLPIIDPSIVTFRGVGCGYTTLDFTTPSFSGAAIRLQLATANAKSRRIVALQGMLLNGSRNRSGTVDAVSLGGDGVYGNALRFADVQISGFRDQVIYGTNAYLNVFDGCILDHCTRYAIDFSGSIVNAGEDEIFDNSVISNGEVGLHVAPTNIAPKFTFKTTSFDFMDQAINMSGLAGTADFIGCHFEGNYRHITDLVVNGTTTATSATANFQPIDSGKRIADITSGTSIPAGVTITYVNSTTVTLSSAATASATITANIASNYYLNDSLAGIVSDHGMHFAGGWLCPSWDATVRNGFIGLSGAVTTGQSRIKISGLAVSTATGSTSKYLIVDTSTHGGNGVQQNGSNTFDVSGVSYPATVSTSYQATWPLRIQDRAGKIYLVHPDHPVQVPAPSTLDWTLRPPQFWETMPRLTARDLFQVRSGTMYLVRLGMADAGWAQIVSATQRWFIGIGAAGSGLTESRISLYWGMAGPNAAWDRSNLRAVANSNNQTALTANAKNKFSTAVTGPISPQYEVWMAYLAIGTTMPQVQGIQYAAPNSLLFENADWSMQAAKLTGQSSSPSTIRRASLVATEFVPWLAVQPSMS
jgi:hypothetical protein